MEQEKLKKFPSNSKIRLAKFHTIGNSNRAQSMASVVWSLSYKLKCVVCFPINVMLYHPTNKWATAEVKGASFYV